MNFYWKSQKFGKSLETFDSHIFVLKFLKSIGSYGFSYGFLVVLNFFRQYCVNPHQNDQGRKGPCYFQRLNALKCL
jgi:hypothetical protein